MPGTVLLTEKMMRDAQEMRKFYRDLGMSLETIERAVERKFAPRPRRSGGGRPKKIKLTIEE